MLYPRGKVRRKMWVFLFYLSPLLPRLKMLSNNNTRIACCRICWLSGTQIAWTLKNTLSVMVYYSTKEKIDWVTTCSLKLKFCNFCIVILWLDTQIARQDFYWKGMKKDLKTFIRECSIYQQMRILLPRVSCSLYLPIPTRVWADITLWRVCPILKDTR